MAILSLSPNATPQWREALASPAVRRTSPLMFIIVFLKEAALYFVTLFASFSGRRRLLSLSGKRDSNPRPSAWEANALPTELLPHCVFHDFDCKFMHCFFPSNIPLHFFFVWLLLIFRKRDITLQRNSGKGVSLLICTFSCRLSSAGQSV